MSPYRPADLLRRLAESRELVHLRAPVDDDELEVRAARDRTDEGLEAGLAVAKRLALVLRDDHPGREVDDVDQHRLRRQRRRRRDRNEGNGREEAESGEGQLVHGGALRRR
jgi:hypothetical protein